MTIKAEQFLDPVLQKLGGGESFVTITADEKVHLCDYPYGEVWTHYMHGYARLTFRERRSGFSGEGKKVIEMICPPGPGEHSGPISGSTLYHTLGCFPDVNALRKKIRESEAIRTLEEGCQNERRNN